jgi:hypothetical protein
MPNHITNILTIHGADEQVDRVLEFIKNDELGVGTIDFNKITPMPPWVFQGNLGREEEEKYGEENCWYDWSIKNWGTKWNAYHQLHDRSSAEDGVVYFDTAWSGVPELMSKLARIFPDVTFYYEFADEDFGNNVGQYVFRGLIINGGRLSDMSKEALELASDLKEKRRIRFDETKTDMSGVIRN